MLKHFLFATHRCSIIFFCQLSISDSFISDKFEKYLSIIIAWIFFFLLTLFLLKLFFFNQLSMFNYFFVSRIDFLLSYFCQIWEISVNYGMNCFFCLPLFLSKPHQCSIVFSVIYRFLIFLFLSNKQSFLLKPFFVCHTSMFNCFFCQLSISNCFISAKLETFLLIIVRVFFCLP